jgi:uncharacterized OB-fold protein
MLLVGALEGARPGDKILLVNYGDGSDAFTLQVTPEIDKIMKRRAITGHLTPKRPLPDYATYAEWRGIVEPAAASRRPPLPVPSAPALWRDRNQVLHYRGMKCLACGTEQYPPQRVCTKCHAKDQNEEILLSDRKGELYTYSMDYIAGTIDVPLVVTITNLEGGARVLNVMTDRDINEIRVGMPVEMSFRKLYSAGGIHNYFWKTIPLRA